MFNQNVVSASAMTSSPLIFHNQILMNKTIFCDTFSHGIFCFALKCVMEVKWVMDRISC